MRDSGRGGLALRLACSSSKTCSGTSLVLLIAIEGLSGEQFEPERDVAALTRLACVNSC